MLQNGLADRGFAPVAEYGNGVFTLPPSWPGVYAWAEIVEGIPVPRRFGKAERGLRGRFRHLNDWLAGKLHADDAREQAVRHFTLQAFAGMAKIEIWALEVGDSAASRALEKGLRKFYHETLMLDLQVKDSWIKKKMTEWRRGRAEA